MDPPIQTLELSKQILDGFIGVKGNTGSRNASTYRNTISRFLIYVQKADFKSILRLDADRFIGHMNTLGHKIAYKKSTIAMLHVFFDYVAENFTQMGIPFVNPIPKLKFCRFAVVDEEEESEPDVYTVEQMIQILADAKKRDYTKYIQLLILTFTGMRISECVSIRRADVNIDERFLLTGREENARKSNKDGNKPLIFFFPEPVANILFDYLQYHKKHFGETQKWLFPIRGSHYTVDNMIFFLKMLKMPFYVASHKFRRTLATFWLNKTNKVALHVVEVLSNHVISNVIYKHYAKKGKLEKRSLYDESFPEEYAAVLKSL
jgi:integrase